VEKKVVVGTMPTVDGASSIHCNISNDCLEAEKVGAGLLSAGYMQYFVFAVFQSGRAQRAVYHGLS
jgi:hypothetical protein